VSQDPNLKLCCDCVHYIYREGGSDPLCGNAKQPIFDMVHGERPRCRTARLDISQLPRVGIVPHMQNCGPGGQHFERKASVEGEPLWRRR